MKVGSLANDVQTFQKHEHFPPTLTLGNWKIFTKEDPSREGGKCSKHARFWLSLNDTFRNPKTETCIFTEGLCQPSPLGPVLQSGEVSRAS